MQEGYNDNQREMYDETEGLSISEFLHILKVRAGWIIVTFLIVVAAAVLYLKTVTPMYESSVTLLVDSLQKGSDIESVLLGQNTQKISTEVELTLSRSNIAQALNLLDLNQYKTEDGETYEYEDLLNAIKTRTSVTTVKDTNIVRITVKDQNMVFARDFANALADSYNDLLGAIAKNSKTVQKDFIQSQIPLNAESLREAADALGTFRQESNYIQLSDKSKVLSEKIAYFQLRREPLHLQRQEASINADSYRDVILLEIPSVPTLDQLLEDTEMDSLIKSYKALLEEKILYEAISTTEVESQNSSRLFELQSSLSLKEKAILDRISILSRTGIPLSAQSSLALREYGKYIHQQILTDAEVSVLTRIEESFSMELSKLPQLERTLLDLQREVEVYEALRMRLMELLEEVKIAEAAVARSVTVVDPAIIHKNPVSPNVMLILAVAVLLGLALGVLLAIVREMSDISIKDETVLRKMLGPNRPLLGWIPLMGFDNSLDYPALVVYHYPLSFEAERYKLIANNVIFGVQNQEPRVCSITSPGMGEGKTTLTANVGVSIAMNNKKVLIIDGDLRLPQLGGFFDLEKAGKGLVDVITKGIPVEEVVIQPLVDVPTLHLLPPGKLPPIPSAIFNSPGYMALLDYLLNIYDYILIDTPPLIFASELMSIAKHVDGIVINVRAGVTAKGALNELVENLTLGNVKIIGGIFNGVIESKMGGHYYGGHYYSYHGYSGKNGYNYNRAEGESGKEKKNILLKTGSYRKFFLKDLSNREKNRHSGVKSAIYPFLEKNRPFAEMADDDTEMRSAVEPEEVDILSIIEQDVDAGGLPGVDRV